MDDDEVQTVFAYGSSLDPERIRERCPSVTGRRRGVLQGHVLVFNKIAVERDGSGYANAEAEPDGAVEGALFEVSRDDLIHRLDRVEGHPYHYSRRLMAVEEADGERTVAWVYFATPAFKAAGLVPSPGQVAQLLRGADLLSAEYAARLRALVA